MSLYDSDGWTEDTNHTTRVVCENMHEEELDQDLGDPADAEIVNRILEDIRFQGCRRLIMGVRCHNKCRIYR